jgi:hypothetical protein
MPSVTAATHGDHCKSMPSFSVFTTTRRLNDEFPEPSKRSMSDADFFLFRI